LSNLELKFTRYFKYKMVKQAKAMWIKIYSIELYLIL
jgi:hypothetical protein